MQCLDTTIYIGCRSCFDTEYGSLRPSVSYRNTFSFTMASKAWNDVLPDLLVRIKPKDTLQYIYEMISGL